MYIILGERRSDHRGLGFKIKIRCRYGQTSINCGPFIKNAYENNLRIVFVMRLLRITREDINIFCGLMDFG